MTWVKLYKSGEQPRTNHERISGTGVGWVKKPCQDRTRQGKQV